MGAGSSTVASQLRNASQDDLAAAAHELDPEDQEKFLAVASQLDFQAEDFQVDLAAAANELSPEEKEKFLAALAPFARLEAADPAEKSEVWATLPSIATNCVYSFEHGAAATA